MASQERIQSRKSERTTETMAAEPTDDHEKSAEQVKADTDALMEDIDDLLSEYDCQAFIDGWVQKGGE